MATIAELNTKITADTSGFSAAMQQSERQVAQFNSRVQQSSGAQAAFGIAIGGTINAVRKFEQGLGTAVAAFTGPVGMIASVVAAIATLARLAGQFDKTGQAAEDMAERTQKISEAMSRIALGNLEAQFKNIEAAELRIQQLMLQSPGLTRFGAASLLEQQTRPQRLMEEGLAGAETFAREIEARFGPPGRANQFDRRTIAQRDADVLASGNQFAKFSEALESINRFPQVFQREFDRLIARGFDAGTAWERAGQAAETAARQAEAAQERAWETSMRTAQRASLDIAEAHRDAAVEAANGIRDALITALDMGKDTLRGLSGPELEAQTNLLNEALVNTLNVPGAADALFGLSQANAQKAFQTQSAAINAATVTLPNLQMTTNIQAELAFDGTLIALIVNRVAAQVMAQLGGQTTQGVGT